MQRELTHHEKLSAHLGKVCVHFSICVVEHPKLGNFGCEPIGVFFRIGVFDAHEDTKTMRNAPHSLAIDADFCPAHPLNQHSHAAK